jgi:selenocysteine lyase/cysteine desulfurase
MTDLDWLDERVPTVSFRLEGKDPTRVAEAIGQRGVCVWNGDQYALAAVEGLGLLEQVAS